MNNCPNCGMPVREDCCTTCGYNNLATRPIFKEENYKVVITTTEFRAIKDMCEELFIQRSEVYITEQNDVINKGERVMTVLQNKFDAINPNII